MNVQHLLPVFMGTMAALGSLLLGMGQQNWWLPALAVTAAGASVYFTDITARFHLPRQITNVVAVVAVLIAAYDFGRHDRESQLLAIANLLIYLQIVLFFQKKSERIYWQIAVLSLLQVVVASAVNLGFEFGLLLALYTLVALATLTLFYVHRESQPYTATVLAGAGNGQAAAVLAGVPASRRWPITAGTSFSRASTTDDPAAAMTNWGVWLQVLKLGITTLALCAVVFFLLPRFGNSRWQGSIGNQRRMTGFTQEVDLDDLGSILESTELVMRVWFYHGVGNRPYDVAGEPYFRGSVLSRYSPVQGRWGRRVELLLRRLTSLRAYPSNSDRVRQKTVLEPQSSRVLFAVTPLFPMKATPNQIQWDLGTRELLRDVGDENRPRDQYTFEVGTTGLLDGFSQPIHLVFSNDFRGRRLFQLRNELSRLDDFEEEHLPNVKAIASGILDSANLSPATDRLLCAQALEAHFLDPGQYVYSLHLERELPPGTDPVDYFVSEDRRGHCEYFASALTLMLRSQGIPARMVIGFKGGEFNSLGNYFQVRQLHTHAWVEVFLEAEQVPADVLPQSVASGQPEPIIGAWLRLDPTPSSDDSAAAARRSGFMAALREISDYCQTLWNDYVLELNSERQREAIYGPIARDVSYFFYGFRVRFSENAGSWVQGTVLWLRGNWFSWRAGLAVMVFGIVMIALYRLLRIPLRYFFGKWHDRRTKRRERQRWRVAFYQRFEHLMARHDLRRTATQTQREFAASVGKRLHCQHSAPLPSRITEAFYRVRFGRQHLDKSETQQLEHAIAQLEQALGSEQ